MGTNQQPPIGGAFAGNPKVDNYPTDGLLGVNNSLAYRVHEIEKHLHSVERWLGSDGDGTGSVANNFTEWRATAGTGGAFGTEVQVLGAGDINATDFGFIPVKFDLHRVFVTSSSANNNNYIVQLWHGPTTFGAAELATEFPYRTGTSATDITPIDVQMGRIPVANKVWARCKCENDGATIDFLIGVHAYVG